MSHLMHTHLEAPYLDLEEMQIIGLFEEFETRVIANARKSFKSALRTNPYSKQDFTALLENERGLLITIAERRETLRCHESKEEIEDVIAARLNKIFLCGISNFADDESLWIEQIDFNDKLEWFEDVLCIHKELLKTSLKSPTLWLKEAKWEMYDNGSPKCARELFQRGAALNPRCGLIWIEHFRMEMALTEHVIKERAKEGERDEELQRQSERDGVLNGDLAKAVFDGAMRIFNDVVYVLTFLDICYAFPHGRNLVHMHIIAKFEEKFLPAEGRTLQAPTWPFCYRTEWIDLAEERSRTDEVGLKNKIMESCLEYENALNVNPTKKKYVTYISFVAHVWKYAKEENLESLVSELQNNLVKLMKSADLGGYLPVGYYNYWLYLSYQKLDIVVAPYIARRWLRHISNTSKEPLHLMLKIIANSWKADSLSVTN